VETERVAYRWWVLVNTFLIFTVAFGMGWTYIVMLSQRFSSCCSKRPGRG